MVDVSENRATKSTFSSSMSRLEKLKEKRREGQKPQQERKSVKTTPSEPRSHMDYTIEETENWHKKQRVDGSENVDKLAELTYYKDILAIKVDLQAYKEGKAADPTELSTILAANTERKTKRKRHAKDADADSYINEKNKQFNMKLNRQK